MRRLKLNNSKKAAIKSGKWKDPGAKLYDGIMKSVDPTLSNEPIVQTLQDFSDVWGIDRKRPSWQKLIYDAYLVAPINKIKNSPYGVTPYSNSGCKYPHHVIKGDELVLSVPGLKAAIIRAKQQKIYEGAVKAHIEKHLKDLGELMTYQETIETNFNDIYDFINESMGICLYETKDEVSTLGDDIQSLNEWVELFANSEEFRENYSVAMNRTTVNEFFIWMQGNIRYGYRGANDDKVRSAKVLDPQDFYDNYRLSSPTKLAKERYGLCWDQVELERAWFSKNGIEHAVFFLMLDNGKECPSHTFLIYKQYDGYYWFEHAWLEQAGLHKFGSLNEAVISVAMKHQQKYDDRISPIVLVWLKKQAPYQCTVEQYWKYVNTQNDLEINSVPNSFDDLMIIQESFQFTEADEPKADDENNDKEEVPPMPEETPAEESPPEMPEAPPEEDKPEEMPELPEEEKPLEDEVIEDDPVEEVKPEETPQPQKQSYPKQTDAAEANKNGVRRKKLYIAFIEWCKEYNPRNIFGSVFDKDAFNVSNPFVPEDMRYFYRLANPMLCVLAGDLTFFPLADLRKVNSSNKEMDKVLIFAATPNDYRVFNVEDKKVYRGTDENGSIKLNEMLGDTFDVYIQNMIKKGDILNGPLEESFTPLFT